MNALVVYFTRRSFRLTCLPDLHRPAQVRFFLLLGFHHSVCRRRRSKDGSRIRSHDCNNPRHDRHSDCCCILHPAREQARHDCRHRPLLWRPVILHLQAFPYLRTQPRSVLHGCPKISHSVRRHHHSAHHHDHHQRHHLHAQLRLRPQGSLDGPAQS